MNGRNNSTVAAICALSAVAVVCSCTQAATNNTRTVDTTAFSATVTLNLAAQRVARSSIAGSNVQWVDGGDNLIADFARGGVASTTAGTGNEAQAGVRAGPALAAYAPPLLRAVESVKPGALRFPGGTNADTYHWKDGVGPVEKRGLGEHVFRKQKQRMVFGTDEFLALSDRLQATPIITVNVPTGTAAEAADWVRYVNQPERASTAPRVKYWEIGNEPYLREELRPELALLPEAFAQRTNEYIRAMKAADPRIITGVPLRLDKLGTLPLVHFPGYAETMLRSVTGPIDFVALHNAYLPLLYKGGKGGTNPDADALFTALMASSRLVSADIANVRALWQQLRPTQPLAIAITEYSSMFTLGGGLDAYVSTVGGALYLADVLQVFAATPEVFMANQWSLNGNGIFGALNTDGTPRPAARILALYARVLRGHVVESSVAAPAFDSPAMGVVPEYRGTPMVSVLATLDSSGANGRAQLHLIVINKSVTRPATFAIQFSSDAVAGARYSVVKAETFRQDAGISVFSTTAPTPDWKVLPADLAGSFREATLPAQSVTHFTLESAVGSRR